MSDPNIAEPQYIQKIFSIFYLLQFFMVTSWLYGIRELRQGLAGLSQLGQIKIPRNLPHFFFGYFAIGHGRTNIKF
jgi:hypothetical protein